MFKKIAKTFFALCLVAAVLIGCSGESYRREPVPGGPAASEAESGNGGLTVKKGDYIYFINGMSSYTESNVFNKVIKGSICRRKIYDETDKVEIIVPKIAVTGYLAGGFYIYGDKIYYTTPNSERDTKGNVQSGIVDFMMVNLDGTNTKRIAKVDPTLNTDGLLPFKFFKTGDKVFLVYISEDSLFSVDTSAANFKINELFEDVSGFAFSDTGVYFTQQQFYQNAQDEDVEQSFNLMFFVNPDGTGKVDISYESAGGTANTTHKYTIIKFESGILFFSKVYALYSEAGIWGYNAGATGSAVSPSLNNKYKKFTNASYDTFLAVGWDDGLVVYKTDGTIGELWRFKSIGEKYIIYKISDATLYYILNIGGKNYLYYGVKDTAFTDSTVVAAYIWRLEIPETEADSNGGLLKSQTQQVSKTSVHNSWLKPDVTDGYIYFFGTATDDDGYKFYTFRVSVETDGVVENIAEEFLGIHDPKDLVVKETTAS
jgi:hypothetical protein